MESGRSDTDDAEGKIKKLWSENNNWDKDDKKMELAIITAKQVLELFILIGAGVVLQKRGMIPEGGKKFLSGLLINFIVPCMILNSYMGSYDEEVFRNLKHAFGYGVTLCLTGMLISFLVSGRISPEKKGVFRFTCTFSNAAYMGFPLIRALFGEEGIIYASAYVTIFNILLWTIGYMFFTEHLELKELWKNLISCPPIIAVAVGLFFYLLHIPVPQLIAEPISMVGAMTTPTSMIITGITVAEANLLAMICKKDIWGVVCVRLVIIPLVCLGIFYVLHLSGMPAMVTLILEACPAAAITTMLAIQYDKDQEYAVGIVVISTICSIVTLPLYSFLLQIL